MKMTPFDRSTFELCEAGLVSETRRPLYEPAITNLLNAGIVHLDDDLYVPVDADRVGRRADGSSRFTPPAPPKPPPMGQIQVRIPQSWIDSMIVKASEQGEDKSTIIRELLRPHFEGESAAPAAPPARAVSPAGKPPGKRAKAPSVAAKPAAKPPTRRRRTA